MKYKILSNERADSLQEEVKHCISKGWVPQGGICSTWSDAYEAAEYMQAMIKNPETVISVGKIAINKLQVKENIKLGDKLLNNNGS